MTKSLKEQAKAFTPKHSETEYKGYRILYPMGRFFIYKSELMVWSCESLTDAKSWIDNQPA